MTARSQAERCPGQRRVKQLAFHAGQKVCRKERFQDRTDAGQVRCRTGLMKDRMVAGQDGCRTGWMQDRTDAGQDR